MLLKINHTSDNFIFMFNCIDSFVEEQVSLPVTKDDFEVLIS
jgi:hypothetical protein